jgi:membrane-bound acyltransferase YfiQ involved in biofilm formation
MNGYDIAAWVVLIVIVLAGIVLSLVLAALPGRIARRRGHPWAEAVHVAGWLTFFLGFALWPLALIWAYVDAPASSGSGVKP